MPLRTTPVQTPFRRPAPPTALGTAALVGSLGLAAVLVPAGPADAAEGHVFRWSNTGAGVHRSSPTPASLSVGPVVVIGDMNGFLTATRANGSVAWRSPVDPAPGARTAVESTPAVGDLDGDGSNDVVVGAGSGGQYVDQHGGVVAYRGDGSVLWRWRAPDRFGPVGRPDGWGDGIYASPALGDVNGDGQVDVSFGGWDQNIWSLNGRDGSVIAGFPFENTDTVWSSPALTDTDRDGVLDLVIGGDQTGNPGYPGSYNGGVLRVLKATGGRVTERYRVNVPDIVASSPAIGDIDGSGRDAAVFVVGNYWRPADKRRVFAVYVDNGSTVPGWPQATDAPGFGSVALGDVVTGDGGRPEVVVGDTDGNVYAWRGNGALAWRSHPGDTAATIFGGPSIGDIDGDGDQDIAIGYCYGGALLLDGGSGRTLGRAVAGPFASEVTPLFTDFAGTTERRLVIAGWNPAVGDFGSGHLAAFGLPASTAKDAWPMFRKDPLHRGGGRTPSPVGGAILAAYQALGGAKGFLGQPLTGELATPLRPGRYNLFQGGSIYWSAATGAQEVHGLIRDRWAALGHENSRLGFPLSNEIPLRAGAFGRFEGGQVYWSAATGAHEVRGAVQAAWGATGYENGPLGYPASDERSTPLRPGAYNLFAQGSVYWSPTTGAHAISGELRRAWERLGLENGALGFPTSGQLPLRGGSLQTFERGQLHWSSATGAHRVQGAVLEAWGRAGYENGTLGFPSTDEMPTPTRTGAFNHFAGGSVYWSPATGAHGVLGPLERAYAAAGWENGCLGFPTAAEQVSTSGGTTVRTARFERGQITWTASGGARTTCA